MDLIGCIHQPSESGPPRSQFSLSRPVAATDMAASLRDLTAKAAMATGPHERPRRMRLKTWCAGVVRAGVVVELSAALREATIWVALGDLHLCGESAKS